MANSMFSFDQPQMWCATSRRDPEGSACEEQREEQPVRRERAEPQFSPGLSEENCPFKLLIDSSLRRLSGNYTVEMSIGDISHV